MSLTKEGLIQYREDSPAKFEIKFGDADIDSLPDGSVFENVAAVLAYLEKNAPEGDDEDEEEDEKPEEVKAPEAPVQDDTLNKGEFNAEIKKSDEDVVLENGDIKHVITQEDLDMNPELAERGVQVGEEIVIPKPADIIGGDEQ